MAKENTMMNILGNGTKLKGNAKISGNLRIDGIFTGEMSITETLIIGKEGKIKGDIESKNCISGGSIKGSLKSSEKVELQAGAIFEGDLICRKLIVEEGVTFDGKCQMSDIKSVKGQEIGKPMVKTKK